MLIIVFNNSCLRLLTGYSILGIFYYELACNDKDVSYYRYKGKSLTVYSIKILLAYQNF